MNMEMLKATAKLNLFALAKIPLILFCSPRVLKQDEHVCEVKIPLNYRTKNHLGSMYFGTLAIGADLAAGMVAMFEIQKSGMPISLVFADIEGKFLKRATEDVIFRCSDVARVRSLVAEAIETGERVQCPVKVSAVMAESAEVAAEFVLSLSLKKKTKE